jgi:hypothetical protein
VVGEMLKSQISMVDHGSALNLNGLDQPQNQNAKSNERPQCKPSTACPSVDWYPRDVAVSSTQWTQRQGGDVRL